MSAISRLFALFLLLAVLGAASPSLAQVPFVITDPTGSSAWEQGGTYPVTWTGGDALWFVNVYLVDSNSWATADIIAQNVPNSGAASYTVPFFVTPGTYLVYVEDVSVTSWTYGENFPINEGNVSVEADTWSRVKALY